MEWNDYDPTWLVEAARDEYHRSGTAGPWLATALAACTRYHEESPAYFYFVDPTNANQPGAEWQFLWNIEIETSPHGALVLDILKPSHAGGQLRVGGVEFLDRIP